MDTMAKAKKTNSNNNELNTVETKVRLLPKSIEVDVQGIGMMMDNDTGVIYEFCTYIETGELMIHTVGEKWMALPPAELIKTYRRLIGKEPKQEE